MLAVIDPSNANANANAHRLKPDHECEVTEPVLVSAELYSDEMTRSVPSIRSHSSQEFMSCAGGSRRVSRKGRPSRACSWQDAAPGVVFKFSVSLHGEQQRILVMSNSINPRVRHRISSLGQPADVSVPGRMFRSRSITSLTDLFLHGRPPPSTRPRSLSVDGISPFSHAPLLSDSDDSDPCSQPGRHLPIGDTAHDSIQNRNLARKKFNAAGTSLAHLVANRLLMTTSRRISAHSAADGCRCSSCNQTVTPYWRDGWAEDVMLCNACGLRFQKFAQRCLYCKYIPRKEDGVYDACPQCRVPWEGG